MCILLFLVLLILFLCTGNAQRSALIHPEFPAVNSNAYLNASVDKTYTLTGPVSSCSLHGGPIPCDCFPVSGRYELTINNTTLTVVSVVPPRVKITLPGELPLLTPATVTISPSLCRPTLHSIQLWHRFLVILPDRDPEWTLISSKSALLKDSQTNITFDCSNFSRTGLYRVDVVGPHNVTITSSEMITVRSSEEMKFNMRNTSIFPYCSAEYNIGWTNTQCQSPLLRFGIRLLAVPEGSGSKIDERAIYAEEIPIEDYDTGIVLPCSQFDIIYEKYCFEITSLEKSSSQVHTWDTMCVRTEPVESVNGGWSVWSDWSDCRGPCGKGLRSRTRSCDSPPPNRGDECIGDVLQTSECRLPPCPVTPSLSTSLTCPCGCVLSDSEKEGTFYAAPNSNCTGNATWTVPARQGYTVDFIFKKVDYTVASVYLYEGQPYKTLIWNSHPDPHTEYEDLSIEEISLSKPLFLVLVAHKGVETAKQGLLVVYNIKRSSEWLAVHAGYRCGWMCEHAPLAGVLLLFFLLLLVIPPYICARLTKLRKRAHSPEEPLICNRPESEMIRSGNTETTQIEATKFVSKRSIGIQLSVHSTPRFARPLDTPLPNGSSAASVLDELEYDYYDGSHEPGSLLAPAFSVIDIDQIIAEAKKVVDHLGTSDAHTQIGSGQLEEGTLKDSPRS